MQYAVAHGRVGVPVGVPVEVPVGAPERQIFHPDLITLRSVLHTMLVEDDTDTPLGPVALPEYRVPATVR